MNVLKSIGRNIMNPKPYDIVGSIVGGIAIALVYLNSHFYILQFPPRRFFLYSGISLILFSLVSYLFIFRLSLPKLDTFPKPIKPLWILSSLLLGVLLSFAFSFSNESIVSWHRLEISPLAGNTIDDIQIIEIENNYERMSYIHEFPNAVHHPWLYNFSIQSTADNDTRIIDFWGKPKDELFILFMGQQEHTPVGINLDGTLAELDLYKPEGEKSISLDLGNHNLSKFALCVLYTIDSITIWFAVLFISIWLWFI